ncbi:MAG TPA: ABC transporter permease, partial [Candidatus Limiplasma sp.]|nr:ABC transporter permease [Candidatus Limiplasma sp.]
VIFTISGALVGLAGVVLMSRLMSGQPSVGAGYEFDAITAVILGGVSFTGGVGSMGGTIIGVFLIQAFNTGLTMVNVPSFWQYVAKGALLLFALTSDFIRKQNRERQLLEASKRNG